MAFCEQQKLIVSNSYFEVPLRRRYTWKGPGDRNRYQIDFTLVKTKFRNQIKSSYDIDSDHNLVMAKYNIKFKKEPKAQKRRNGALKN